MLKPRFLGSIAAVVIVTMTLAACSDDSNTASSDNDTSSDTAQTSTTIVASDLSVAEQLKAKYPTGVVDIQSFACEPRSDDEWYRTDHTLAIDPSDPNTMYINVEWKGVYKTIDGGATWKPSSTGILAYAREDDKSKRCFSEYPTIKINPVDPDHLVLIASGGGGGYLSLTENNSQTGGIYQSFNGGENWVLSTADNMNLYSTDAAFSADGQTIFYATASNPASWGGADQNKLYVKDGLILASSDKGKTWTELPTGIGERTSVTNIHIDPKDPNVMVAPTFSAQRSSADGSGTGISDGKIVTANQLGVLRTVDGGKTWTASESSKSFPIVSSAVSKNNFANQFFVPFTAGAGEPFGYVSTDGGVTLQQTKQMDVVAYDPADPAGNRMLGVTSMVIGQPSENLTMWQSTDAGLTWKKYGSLPAEIADPASRKTRVSGITWHPTQPGTIFLNGAGGHVWKSTDSAKTWTTLLSVDTLPAQG